MYCPNCGADLPENGRFCENCGAPVPQKPASQQPGKINLNAQRQQLNNVRPANIVQPENAAPFPKSIVRPEYPAQQGSVRPQIVSRGWDSIRARLCLETQYDDADLKQAQKQKLLGELKIFLCLIVPLALVLIFSVICVRNQPVGLDNFVQVTFSGQNGNGTAQVTFNTGNFETAYESRLERHAKQQLPVWYSSYAEMFRDFCVTVSLDKTRGLSNGDVVTCHVNCDDELARQLFGVETAHDDMKFTVSGLQ